MSKRKPHSETSAMIVHGQTVPLPADLSVSAPAQSIAVESRHLHAGQFASVLYLVALPERLASAVIAIPAGIHIAVLGARPVYDPAASTERPVFRLQAHEIEVCLQCLTARNLHLSPAAGLRGTLMLSAHGGCFGNPPQSLSMFPDAPADAVACPRCSATDVHVIRYRAWYEAGQAATYEVRGLTLALDGFIVLVNDPVDDTESEDEVAQCQHCGHEGDLAAFDKYGFNFGSGWASPIVGTSLAEPASPIPAPAAVPAAVPAAQPSPASGVLVYVGVEVYRDQGPCADNWDYRFVAASPDAAIALALDDAGATQDEAEQPRIFLRRKGVADPQPCTRAEAAAAIQDNPDAYLIVDRGSEEAVMIVCDGLAG